MLKYVIVIPAHNEAQYIGACLDSVISQTIPPTELIVVNDHSSDATAIIVSKYAQEFDYIKLENRTSDESHMPGSKVVAAFNQGYKLLSKDWDYLVKLDADIVLPHTYFEEILGCFQENPSLGIAGGIAYEKDSNGLWKRNHPMNKNHIRGAFKTYSRACFKSMNGLKEAMGWDTVDELLAQYHGYEIATFERLKVQHWRPIGSAYNKKAKYLQGEAMYRMRYQFLITLIASLKMSLMQQNLKVFFDTLKGFIRAQNSKLPYIVSKKEGAYIRKHRWKGMLSKLY